MKTKTNKNAEEDIEIREKRNTVKWWKKAKQKHEKNLGNVEYIRWIYRKCF